MYPNENTKEIIPTPLETGDANSVYAEFPTYAYHNMVPNQPRFSTLYDFGLLQLQAWGANLLILSPI